MGISRRTRFISILVFILFFFVTVASLFFIIDQADHECSGTKCSICHKIIECKNLLKTNSCICQIDVIQLFLFLMITISMLQLSMAVFQNTLVSLKVKLSN